MSEQLPLPDTDGPATKPAIVVKNPDKPDSCLGCPLYLRGEGFVPGEGPIDSRIMIVGEAPGEDEVAFGRPFFGSSGRVLAKQLSLAGIDKRSCYVTNIVKCRPHSNDGKNRQPSHEEIKYCSQYMVKELRASTANVIVALGTTAMGALTDRWGIEKYRGTPVESGGRKVIGTIHPAAIMRNQEMWPVVIFDLVRTRKESSTPEVYVSPTNYITDARVETHGAALVERARRLGRVFYDLEAAGSNPKKPYEGALNPRTSEMVCMGLGVEPREAFCFRWPGRDHSVLTEVFADPSIEKVGQYSESYDQPYSEGKGYKFAGPTFDTMQAAHLINPGLPKDLGFLGSQYADFPNWKDDKKDIFLYNCRDIDVTARAYVGQKKELRSLGLENLFYKSVMPLQPRLRRMSALGIKKNVNMAELWSSRIRTICNEREDKLRRALDMPYLNVQSPPQLKDLFYNKMGLPVQYTRDAKTKEWRPTCNKEALEKLATLTDSKIFHEVIEIRSARQNVATFIDVEHDEYDFVHPHFGTAKAGTGRVNSEDPNGQNIPVQLREIYVPDSPDHIFLELDWSQVEWRLQVVLTGDRRGLELLASGRDNHRAVAAEILGKRYEDVTEDERYHAKFVVHGLGYGRGAASIAKQYGIPLAIVEAFIAGFARRFSDFWTHRDEWVKFVGRNAYLANAFGRRRWWFTRTVTEIYNFLAQSTAADMMYEVINDGHDHCPANWSMRLTVHDSLLLCGPKENVKEAWEFGHTLMQRTWDQVTQASRRPDLIKQYYPNGWWCQADAALGETWKQCKPKTKEDKLWQAEAKAHYGIKEAA